MACRRPPVRARLAPLEVLLEMAWLLPRSRDRRRSPITLPGLPVASGGTGRPALGPVAQLGERDAGSVEVRGSSPLRSTALAGL